MDENSLTRNLSDNAKDGFILDNFEQQAILQNNYNTINQELNLENDNVNVKDGKVVGPRNVLVYDTSLRGKMM